VQSAVLSKLGLPAGVQNALQKFAASDAGMLILTGPAGSGKTTTIYALLAEILRINHGGVSIVALEDPVERSLPGITQIEVAPFGQLTYERALRSILRQDPQVLMLGEIRDAAVASLAIQAALSGHRLVTTLHAATPGMAIARLLEMGVERYQVTSSLWAVVNQRLVRRKTPDGYSGRAPVAEYAMMDAAMRKIVLENGDAGALDHAAVAQADYRSMAQSGADMVQAGITDQAEILRVLGQK
jgi:general secretion pathway protein E